MLLFAGGHNQITSLLIWFKLLLNNADFGMSKYNEKHRLFCLFSKTCITRSRWNCSNNAVI